MVLDLSKPDGSTTLHDLADLPRITGIALCRKRFYGMRYVITFILGTRHSYTPTHTHTRFKDV